MKLSLILSILLLFAGGCASLPPETQIVNFFNQKQADPEILSDPSIARWVASGNLNGTIYYDYPNGIRYFADVPIDKNGAIAIDWGVYGIPETFIVNSKGVIKYRHIGPVTKEIYKKINLLIEKIE